MRQESEHLMKFAKDMGFVANQPQEPSIKNQNYLIVNAPSEKARSIPIQSEIAKGAEQLSPMEREKLIHQLQGQLEKAVETEFVSTDEKECNESTESQEN
jgi:phenylacetate-coenzyme A ligase PaaK-like adenylate-forming protein